MQSAAGLSNCSPNRRQREVQNDKSAAGWFVFACAGEPAVCAGRVLHGEIGAGLRTILPMATYLPTALLLITPFATLPIGLAQVLWMILTAGSFIFAANLQKYRIQD
jgi:hypothetical protein